MKICMVTGGSGGHIYPALTFADYVKENRDHEIFFIGNDLKMESTIVPDHGYPFYGIHNKGLQGSKLDKIKAVLGQFSAIREAKKILKETKPDLVFAFGGYVTLPVVLAAKQLKIKIALHEQNALVGKANKMASKYAFAIFTSYEESFKGEPNIYFYGNPRGALAAVSDTSNLDEINRLGLDVNKKIVLCVMGSQGSTAMNVIFKEMVLNAKDLEHQIIVVTGPTNYDDFMKDIDVVPQNVVIQPFVKQALLLPFLDLIVARAGASTITEIAAFGLPSILVPSPYVANNHQFYNAKALEDKSATRLIEEKDLNGTILLESIEALLNDEHTLEMLSQNVREFATPDVNKNILNILEQLV